MSPDIAVKYRKQVDSRRPGLLEHELRVPPSPGSRAHAGLFYAGRSALLSLPGTEGRQVITAHHFTCSPISASWRVAAEASWARDYRSHHMASAISLCCRIVMAAARCRYFARQVYFLAIFTPKREAIEYCFSRRWAFSTLWPLPCRAACLWQAPAK